MRRRKKKIDSRKITLIVLLIVFLVIGYLANVVFSNRQLTIFEKALKDGVLTVQNVITYPVDLIIEKINTSKEKNKMYAEYESLKKQLDDAKVHILENEELKKQVQDLKEMLELNNVLSDYESINATVISRDLAYWSENIIIDKGENAGIKVNMPVVVNGNLIGKVIKTTAFSSTVRLLTSSTTDKISVKIKNGDQYIYGILSKYEADNDIYIIEGISESIEIEQNSIVTTTGMGDIYPSGIVIGKIVGIDTDNFDLFKVLQMKSEINFDSINYITVLKRGEL